VNNRLCRPVGCVVKTQLTQCVAMIVEFRPQLFPWLVPLQARHVWGHEVCNCSVSRSRHGVSAARYIASGTCVFGFAWSVALVAAVGGGLGPTTTCSYCIEEPDQKLPKQVHTLANFSSALRVVSSFRIVTQQPIVSVTNTQRRRARTCAVGSSVQLCMCSGRIDAGSTSNATQHAVRAALKASGITGMRGSAGVVCALF
jgi:hypothetical protein